MTENKRFTLAYKKDDWWAVRDGEITLWKEEVIYLLNELHEENKRLKQENNQLKKENKELKHHLSELQGENEILNKENAMLKNTIARNEAHIERMQHKGEWKK